MDTLEEYRIKKHAKKWQVTFLTIPSLIMLASLWGVGTAINLTPDWPWIIVGGISYIGGLLITEMM